MESRTTIVWAHLLAAKVVVYADPVRGGAAGIHITDVIRKLGIAEQLKAKTKLGAGGDVHRSDPFAA